MGVSMLSRFSQEAGHPAKISRGKKVEMGSKTHIWFGICAVSFVFAAGCSGDAADVPKTVAVSGTVSYNGNPVAGATVTFMGEGAPRAAIGTTDAEGKFQLSTFGDKDGAVVGAHVITVSKIEDAATTPAGDDPALDDPTALAQVSSAKLEEGPGSAPQSELPAKYANTSSSPLKETVTAEGPNEFVLKLEDG